MATTRLDRAQVVDTALRLLNEVGLEGLTLRRIAKELGVQAPALYWHFRNKQELLDEMATDMLRRMTVPLSEAEGAPGGGVSWQDAITFTCRELRKALLGYRDGAKVFSGTRLTDLSHIGAFDSYLGALTGAGFALRDAVNAYFTSYAFTIGFVIEEQSVYPVPGGERDPHYDVAERADRIGEEFPLAAAAGADLFSDYDARFETGLRIVVAGIEQTLSPTAP
ncbi:TetR/AcrR family transcriptional regulator C-terminal domain-containing protein [Streptomyces sp. 8N616]|uniref:TetR/AcrR family transcriptional regulator C-terminal domain-containing protein n=1 Tax=Streptomyces sp. 8N616 TaxID=3457414 RepID=UPI003FCF16F0